MNKKYTKLVFLCGARDYHAIDWYRSARLLFPNRETLILTDLITGEGFKKLVSDEDKVHHLLILDRFLFSRQSRLGNYWRNMLKLIVFPIQALLLNRFSQIHPNAIYHAHSMYYLWLASAAGVPFVGTPQGSDILIKPYKSIFYRFASSHALRCAKAVTVDSNIMAQAVSEIADVKALVLQNGIDLSNLEKTRVALSDIDNDRRFFVSIRAMTPLYRIDKIILARNRSDKYKAHNLRFIYPFQEFEYLTCIRDLMDKEDQDLGRLNRSEMYEILFKSKLVFSIPSSDSSPRSVFEAIFCGAAVALTYHPFIDTLPVCMKSRIIIIDLEDDSWFDSAIEASERIILIPYIPSEEALDTYDQVRSFKIIDSHFS
jgi:hypothetical protein